MAIKLAGYVAAADFLARESCQSLRLVSGPDAWF